MRCCYYRYQPGTRSSQVILDIGKDETLARSLMVDDSDERFRANSSRVRATAHSVVGQVCMRLRDVHAGRMTGRGVRRQSCHAKHTERGSLAFLPRRLLMKDAGTDRKLHDM
jgi:hypothetical protein